MDEASENIGPESLGRRSENIPKAHDLESFADNAPESLEVESQSNNVSSASDTVNQIVKNLPQTTLSTDQSSIQATDSAQADDTSSLIADDVDVIEKVWVQKAKTIVNETKDDPHNQSAQLSSMKIDYIKKRFSKDIKTMSDKSP